MVTPLPKTQRLVQLDRLLWALALCTACLLIVPKLLAIWSVELQSVHGSVLVDGVAPAGAILRFHPIRPTAWLYFTPTAVAAEDGTFELASFGFRRGAPIGTYAVTIEWHALRVTENGIAAGQNLLPNVYSSSRTTPLIAEVTPGSSQLPTLHASCCCRTSPRLLSCW